MSPSAQYDCQGIDDNWIQSAVGRVTYQATLRNKIAVVLIEGEQVPRPS